MLLLLLSLFDDGEGLIAGGSWPAALLPVRVGFGLPGGPGAIDVVGFGFAFLLGPPLGSVTGATGRLLLLMVGLGWLTPAGGSEGCAGCGCCGRLLL